MKRHREPRPVWIRLAALLVIPLLGMASTITPSLLGARRTAAAAAELARETADLQRLIELQAAVAREQLSSEAIMRIRALGASPELATSVLGFDPRVRVGDDRRGVDQAMALVGTPTPAAIAAVSADIGELRAISDGPPSDADQLHDGFRAVQAELVRMVTVAVRALAAGDAAHAAGGHVPIAVLDRVVGISHAGIEEVAALSELLLTPPEAHPAAHARLIGWAALYAAETEALGDTSADWKRRLGELARDPRFVHLFALFADTVSTTAELKVGWDRIVLVLGAGGAFSEAMSVLATTATTETTAWATGRSAEASRELRNLAIEAAAILLATTLLAAGSARLIGRHLGRLAAKAQSLSEGRLDDASGRPTGPREIATVGRALNDAVANLRHIEAQAAALAAGRLDDPSLARAAPGQLGALVHGSVGQLTGAWRERERLRERLQHEATHDRLTGLPNRAVAIDALRGALRVEQPVAVLFVDLDGFKTINDSFGHLYGDQVLREVADRLSDAVRRGDVLARLGGDEFVVVAAGVDSSDVAMRLGERLRASVATIEQVDGRAVAIGASVGVAMAPEHGSDETSLIGRADEAVYAAKRSGRGSVVLHGAAA